MKNILNTAYYLMDSAFISTRWKVIASGLLLKYRVWRSLHFSVLTKNPFTTKNASINNELWSTYILNIGLSNVTHRPQ